MKDVMCQVCERSYLVLQLNKRAKKELGRNPNNYICDSCRMHSNNPRNIKPQHIQIIREWEPDERPTAECSYCGTQMWLQQFRLLIDREVVLTDSDIMIKTADEVISHHECPNPECEKGWGKQPQHRFTPIKLAPPWSIVQAGMFPEIDAMPRDSQREEFHSRWWFLYNKERARNAGKGVTLKGMMNATE